MEGNRGDQFPLGAKKNKVTNRGKERLRFLRVKPLDL